MACNIRNGFVLIVVFLLISFTFFSQEGTTNITESIHGNFQIDGQYYTENLINYDLLNEQLNKKKIKLINHGSFDTFLDDFDANKNHFSKQLRTIDKEYISLYHFYVYKKLK